MSDTVGSEKRGPEEEGSKEETKKPKISISLGTKPAAPAAKGISISLGQKAQPGPAASANPKPTSAAAAFLGDDDEEEEDMPPEARMRMRNVGKNTPTSAGPNSFSKSQGGFTDNNKTWEKTQEKLAQDVGLDLADKKPPEPKIKIDTFKKVFEKTASDSE